MLLRFNVANFLSFDELIEFNSFTGDYRRLDNHIERVKNIDILKLCSLYGANASGKSNLIKAISYLSSSVKNGELSKQNFSTFKGNDDKPSVFEIEFLTNNTVYIYGIEVFKDSLTKEYLYFSGLGNKDKLIFDRKILTNGENKIEVDKKFLNNQKNKILKEHYEKKVVGVNKLFLSAIDDIDLGNLSKEAKVVVEWFWGTQIIFPDSKPTYLMNQLLSEPSFMEFSRDMLCSFDTGIKDLHIKTFDLKTYFGEDDKKFVNEIIELLEKDDEDVVLSFDMIATIEDENPVIKMLFVEHIGFGPDNLFSLEEESDGTNRLIEFMTMLFNLIVSEDDKGVFIIDEIGRSIHPSLLKDFLNKLSNENKINGQLIFTTHESNLLDLKMLRPDEIWFCEKNRKKGNTEFKTLAEFKKIRTDLDIRKGYLNGRFGGIPILANFEDLNWTEYATN